MIKLYTYFRSSAAFRVRIALNLKGLAFESVPVHLLRHGGMQHTPEYAALNPSELVPTLVDDALTLVQSMAIMEYLEETRPEPPLLPSCALGRARVRALAQTIACEIHPLNNLRVMQYLEQTLKLDTQARTEWCRHWVMLGFTALEKMLTSSPETGAHCHGDTPTMADCCLVPQVANARRFDTPLDAFPNILRIEATCLTLPAFQRALPNMQPDAT